MTTQTKVFIELSDIIGLRLKCNECGCSLLLESDKDTRTIENMLAPNNVVLSKCPTCDHPWTQTMPRSAGWDSDIKEFFRKLRDLKKSEAGFGCSLSLEIDPGEDE